MFRSATRLHSAVLPSLFLLGLFAAQPSYGASDEEKGSPSKPSTSSEQPIKNFSQLFQQLRQAAGNLRASLTDSQESLRASKQLTRQLQEELKKASYTLASLRASLASSKLLSETQAFLIDSLEKQIVSERLAFGIGGGVIGFLIRSAAQ